MSAAEVLIAHQKYYKHGDDADRCAACDWRGTGDDDFAAHQVGALRAAGYAVIELPCVAYKGPLDTDANFFRQVADRMDDPARRIDYLSGSNVRRAVRQLLYRAAEAAEAVTTNA